MSNGNEINALAAEVIALAIKAGKTLGTAESCTGGGIGQALTAISGSSAAYEGGVISYSNAVKTAVLGIPNEIIEFYGAVSEPVASAMALQARGMLGVDIAVSVTGIAGPGGGSDDKPVGMVCFGIADGGPARTQTMQFGDLGRDGVRATTIIHALDLLKSSLKA